MATGNELRFGAAGARVTATSSQLTLFAGDLDGDDLLLYAGNDAADGGIEIMGNAHMDIRSGNGVFNFLDGAGATRASIDAAGAFTASHDLVVSGNEIRLGGLGARLTASTASLVMAAGDVNTDVLTLFAGNDLTDGGVGDDRARGALGGRSHLPPAIPTPRRSGSRT